ncbi:MAG: UvrD-helicase domain-containing protein [Clostridia bacterium]|nr:UvrD-helicase domain-containing protein [Clostridia bacterium]
MSAIDKKEIQYLKMVQDFIDREVVKLNNLAVELENKVMDEGQKFSLDNPYASVYGGNIVTEHQHSMERKIQRCENAKNEAFFLQKIRSNPYFARIDFAEDGYDAEEFYIGIKTLFDEKELAPYVYDWRAPVASLFYEDFDDGKAYFDAPSGKIEGQVQKRYQYKFKDGQLTSCFESELKVDDVILQKALSESSTDRLKVIVNSIQKEQNRAIRFGGDKNLIVCGPAGSGKTSVGFHRLAYLLYANRNSLSSAEIVMFTGSDIFASYVSDIIPELGEAPIKDFNFYKMISRQLGSIKYSDYYSLTESILTGSKKRVAEAKIKYSKNFIDFLEKYVQEKSVGFTGFSLYGDEVYSGEEIAALLAKKRKIRKFNDQLRIITTYSQEKIDQYFAENYNKIYEILNEETSILDETAEQVSKMREEIKNQARQKLQKELDGNDFHTLGEVYEQYEKETGCTTPLFKNYKKNLGRNFIEFEDAILIIYIKCLLGKIALRTNVRHVLIDEAQDFSPIQHKIIKYLYPKANFTILTDARQAIFPFINSTDIAELASIYEAETMELKKSFRSTKEINAFAMKLLKNVDYETFDRSGDEPEIIETENVIDEIKLSLKNAEGSACVITKTTALAREIFNRLIDEFDVEIYDDRKKIFSDKIGIMPVAYTKGLEFDNVIIVSNSENDFYSKGSEPFLYMASTRALHKLKIVKEK